jgi:hypothetical protein
MVVGAGCCLAVGWTKMATDTNEPAWPRLTASPAERAVHLPSTPLHPTIAVFGARLVLRLHGPPMARASISIQSTPVV